MKKANRIVQSREVTVNGIKISAEAGVSVMSYSGGFFLSLSLISIIVDTGAERYIYELKKVIKD